MKKEQSFFIKNFKKILQEKGFTQQELANKLGIKQAMISQWISGFRNPSLTSLKRISVALDIPFDYFVDGKTLHKDIKSQEKLFSEMNSKMNLIEEKIKEYAIENDFLKTEIKKLNNKIKSLEEKFNQINN